MNFAKLFVLMIVALLAFNIVSATTSNLEVVYVEINGDALDMADDHNNNLEVKRGETLDLKVRVKALADLENVQLGAEIFGDKDSHKYSEKLNDESKTFDMSTGDIKNVYMSVEIPTSMDKKYTKLWIIVGDEDGDLQTYAFELHIVGVEEDEAVIVKDYSFSPSSTINAGRAFTAMVRVQNIGDDDLDDVKVTVAIPELNVRDSEYLDELEADEKETLEEFLLRIPDCAEPGVYEVEIMVEFDDIESTTETADITVLSGDTCTANSGSKDNSGKAVVMVPEAQEVEAGNEVAFPIVIANQGTSAKTFTVTVSGVESWGSSRLSPSSVVIVPAESTKTVYLYVEANEDAEGEKLFMATISSGEDSEAIPLTANVVGDDSNNVNLKRGLEVALVVLVIILIIVGLIIAFNKLRGNDEEGTQTYY
ncbi:MAG: putative S-layer protein [archaeon]